MKPPKSVMRRVERAIRDFNMFSPGDRVAVGISGGKDSLLLLQVMRALALRDDFDIEVHAVHLDQGQPGFDMDGLKASMAALDVELIVIDRQTWPVVESQLSQGQIPCALCSRMRRGVLLDWCKEKGFNRLAIGHHLDDAIETFFLNLFYQRRLDPLKPVTPSDVTNVSTVPPMIFVEEEQVIDWIAAAGLAPIGCPVCDTFPRSSRRDIGQMVKQMRALHPELTESVRQALYGEAATSA